MVNKKTMQSMLDCTFTEVAFERLTNEDEPLIIHFFLNRL
jgi:hypothetical protein